MACDEFVLRDSGVQNLRSGIAIDFASGQYQQDSQELKCTEGRLERMLIQSELSGRVFNPSEVSCWIGWRSEDKSYGLEQRWKLSDHLAEGAVAS
jgi:hypothetical protein